MKISVLLFWIYLVIIATEDTTALTTWMCRGWPLTIACDDSSQLTLVNAKFEPLKSSRNCETTEGLTPAPLLALTSHPKSKCSLGVALKSATKLCDGQNECVLSEPDLFSEPCHFPDESMLEIEYQCKKRFTCPREILAISSQRYSRNLHRRPASWCRDPVYNTNAVYLMPWARNRETRAVYEYSTLTSFVLGRPSGIHRLPFAAAGTSMVAYDRHLYYVKDRTRNLTKYNLQNRQKVLEKAVGEAFYNHEINYSGLAGSSDIDLAVDENGLWAIYSTAKSDGNIVLSLISLEDLSIQASWETDIKKSDLLNTFVVCGTLYAISRETRRVYKKFDTATNTSSDVPSQVNITMPWKETTSVNYSPLDNTLYVWSTSQAIMFTLDMKSSPTQTFSGIIDENSSKTAEHTTTTANSYQAATGRKENLNLRENGIEITEELDITYENNGIELEPAFIETTIENCPATMKQDMLLPEISPGLSATLPCPGGARGFASWGCVIDDFNNTVWDSTGPNLSQCSTWTIAIDEKLSSGSSISSVYEIAKDLSDAVNILKESEAGLKGNDLHHSSEIMSEIANLAKVSPGNLDTNSETEENMLMLNKAIVDSGSNLVGEEMSGTWKGLDMEEKCHVGNNIMNSVEESAFLLAGQEKQMLDVANVTIVTRVVEENNILVGIQVQRVEERDNGTSSDENVTFPDPSLLKEDGNWMNVTDSIQISAEDIESNQQHGKTSVVFTLYNRLAGLMDEENEDLGFSSTHINSRIVSATIQSANHRIHLKSPAIITLEHVKGSNGSHTCVYWNNMAKNNSDKWLTDGCTLVSTNWTHTVCACEHLTSFAVLVNHMGFVFEKHITTLDVLTWAGLSSSLVCLALCIGTFTYFRSLHCTRTTIHTNLCVCLFMSQLIFLAGIDLYEFHILCSVVAGLLHYCFLATFMWMALEGFQLYVMLVEVFERNTNITWYYLVGYGVPAVFVGLSAGLNPMGYGTENACWLKTDVHGDMGTIGGFSPFIWAFIGPASLVALGNVVFLALTAFTMYRHGRKYIYYSKLRAIRSALRGTFALLCLLGTTWALGILWWWEDMVILAYLFCILNAFQGVYIFVFHCLMHNKVRYEYRKLLSQCLGDNYTDLPNSSSLTMKYSGMRRRSTQTYFSQKRKNSTTFKTSVRSNHFDEKQNIRRGSFGTKSAKNFSDASKFFTTEDRASMQILLTRRDSQVTPHVFNFSSPLNGSFKQRHPRTFSTQSCPSRCSQSKPKLPGQKQPSQDEFSLKRSFSEKRHTLRKYNVPVSEGVSRLLLSAGSSRSIIVPNRYSNPESENGSLTKKFDSNPRTLKSIPKSEIFRGAPSTPVVSFKKEVKFVDKRLSRFKSPTFQLGRSSSMNAAEKKRRDLRKMQIVKPASSVPDLMSQLSAKIESRSVSNVLLMYLDKDGTLNRAKMEQARNEENKSNEK